MSDEQDAPQPSGEDGEIPTAGFESGTDKELVRRQDHEQAKKDAAINAKLEGFSDGRSQGIEIGQKVERQRITEQIKQGSQIMQEIAQNKDMKAMAETFAEELLDEVEQE